MIELHSSQNTVAAQLQATLQPILLLASFFHDVIICLLFWSCYSLYALWWGMRLLGLQGSRTEPCNQVNIIADGDNNLLLIIVNNSGFF